MPIVLNSIFLPDDSCLIIPEYLEGLIKKRGGVCIYYKSYLPLRIMNMNYLNECVRLELMVVTNFATSLYYVGLQVNLKINSYPL